MLNERENEGITLGDIFSALKKGWAIILVVFLAVFVIGSVFTFKVKKNSYYSTGSITVEYKANESSETVDITSSLLYVQTVGEFMTSNKVLANVVESLSEYDYDVESIRDVLSVSYSTNSMIITYKAVTDNGQKCQDVIEAFSSEIEKYSCDSNSDYEKFYCRITVRDNGENFYKEGPNRVIYMIITVLAGLVLGCLFVLVKELASNKFKTREQVEGLGYPIIGVNFEEKSKRHVENDDLIKPSIKNFEPYNRLLSNIKLSNLDNPAKLIMVTSTGEKEYKTTVISNLAYAAANNKKKVIIVDLDIRKPRIHKVFKLSRNEGLVDYLEGSIELDKSIKKTNIGVDVICSGKKVDNPVVIFESDKLKNLLVELKTKYDYVFVDTAPLLACNDAMVLASSVDGAIYNVALNASTRKEVRTSLDSLSKLTSVIGVNITRMKNRKTDGYYYYQYGYGSEKE